MFWYYTRPMNRSPSSYCCYYSYNCWLQEIHSIHDLAIAFVLVLRYDESVVTSLVFRLTKPHDDVAAV